MFGCDNFGPHVDYYSTYSNLGGEELASRDVCQIINNLYDHLLAIGRDPANYDHFGTVRTYLEQIPDSEGLPDVELKILEQVFAHHEVGTIPASHAKIIGKLKSKHSLGVVSNIWSHRALFVKELKRAGIYDLFDTIVWSSDHGCIKPSPILFRKALAQFPVETAEVLFVGDNLKRDVGGAKAMGMSTVWINDGEVNLSAEDPQPDLIIPDLGNLLIRGKRR